MGAPGSRTEGNSGRSTSKQILPPVGNILALSSHPVRLLVDGDVRVPVLLEEISHVDAGRACADHGNAAGSGGRAAACKQKWGERGHMYSADICKQYGKFRIQTHVMFGNSMPTSVGAAAASAATSAVRFMRRALYSARKASWDWRTVVEKERGNALSTLLEKYSVPSGASAERESSEGSGFSASYHTAEKKSV